MGGELRRLQPHLSRGRSGRVMYGNCRRILRADLIRLAFCRQERGLARARMGPIDARGWLCLRGFVGPFVLRMICCHGMKGRTLRKTLTSDDDQSRGEPLYSGQLNRQSLPRRIIRLLSTTKLSRMPNRTTCQQRQPSVPAATELCAKENPSASHWGFRELSMVTRDN